MSISCLLFLFLASAVSVTVAEDQCVNITVTNAGAYAIKVEFPDLGLMTIEKPYASTPCGEVELGVGAFKGDVNSYRIPKGSKVLLDAIDEQKEFVAAESTDYVCRRGEFKHLECSETRRQ